MAIAGIALFNLSVWGLAVVGFLQCRRAGLSFDGYSFPRKRFAD